MALKYGDVVVLVLKSRVEDKDVLRRVNAVVLDSAIQLPGATSRTGLKTAHGIVLPEGEYLDVCYPDPALVSEGQRLKSRNIEQIFRFASAVPAWKDGLWVGWEVPSAPSVETKKLRDFLFANFKDETGNETPEACAIRLLTKRKGRKGNGQDAASDAAQE
jgi:hypothetical protein